MYSNNHYNFVWRPTTTTTCVLSQNWPSQVYSLEEEVAWLKQELKESEMNREKLSAELRECRKIIVESGVSGTGLCIHTLPCLIAMLVCLQW